MRPNPKARRSLAGPPSPRRGTQERLRPCLKLRQRLAFGIHYLGEGGSGRLSSLAGLGGTAQRFRRPAWAVGIGSGERAQPCFPTGQRIGRWDQDSGTAPGRESRSITPAAGAPPGTTSSTPGTAPCATATPPLGHSPKQPPLLAQAVLQRAAQRLAAVRAEAAVELAAALAAHHHELPPRSRHGEELARHGLLLVSHAAHNGCPGDAFKRRGSAEAGKRQQARLVSPSATILTIQADRRNLWQLRPDRQGWPPPWTGLTQVLDSKGEPLAEFEAEPQPCLLCSRPPPLTPADATAPPPPACRRPACRARRPSAPPAPPG